MKKFIMTNISIILTAIGTGLFTYGFFRFITIFVYRESFYKSQTSIILSTIGAVLIAIGLLLKTKKD
jgi:hypothetical protein